MAPVDIPKQYIRGVLLVKDMILAIVANQAMRLVGPIGSWKEMVFRAAKIVVETLLRDS
jgi:hypothetical protein